MAVLSSLTGLMAYFHLYYWDSSPATQSQPAPIMYSWLCLPWTTCCSSEWLLHPGKFGIKEVSIWALQANGNLALCRFSHLSPNFADGAITSSSSCLWTLYLDVSVHLLTSQAPLLQSMSFGHFLIFPSDTALLWSPFTVLCCQFVSGNKVPRVQC